MRIRPTFGLSLLILLLFAAGSSPSDRSKSHRHLLLHEFTVVPARLPVILSGSDVGFAWKVTG